MSLLDQAIAFFALTALVAVLFAAALFTDLLPASDPWAIPMLFAAAGSAWLAAVGYRARRSDDGAEHGQE